MSSATSVLLLSGKSFWVPSANSSVTLLVSQAKPAPGVRSELSTMKSRFFRFSLSVACSNSWSVSSANPTSFWPSRLIAPKARAMSWVGMRSRCKPPDPSRLILCLAVSATVKSATAAHSIPVSQCGKMLVAASYICCALVTSVRLM